jgi:lipid A 3-O-deacylase
MGRRACAGKRDMKSVCCAARRLTLAFAASLLAAPASAGTTGYDINVLMYQPHPFANGAPAYPAYPAAVPAPVPAMRLRQPARMPAPSASPAPARSAASPTAEQRRPPVMVQPTGRAAELHEPRSGGWRSIFSEVRLGFLVHDEGPFSRNEESGYDGNLEILFASPRFLDIIWAPRPHLGLSVNSDGDTSQAYFGLTWEWTFWGNWFAGFSFGGSVHDGETTTDDLTRKELGCHLLFRESVEGGYRFNNRHSISLFLDHISNANICDANEGLENWGVRYGYTF